jgi:mono/diheme cytochrome c family protein
MTPLPSAILTCVFILCGIAAMMIMLNRLGGTESQPTPRQILWHQFFGWVFAASFVVLFATMFVRFYSFWEEHPPRIVFHYTVAFAIPLLLFLKIAIPRKYPSLRKHLFQLGVVVLLLALLTAGSGLAHYFVRLTQKTPYLSHAPDKAEPDLAMGKELFIERCGTCHLLENILRPRPAQNWEKVVEDMTMIAWPRIRPDEATQILFYLTETRSPKDGGAGPSELQTHCFSCHETGEIFTKQRTRREWDAIVRAMTDIAPEKVPANQHDRIVDALVETQEKQEAKR